MSLRCIPRLGDLCCTEDERERVDVVVFDGEPDDPDSSIVSSHDTGSVFG